MRSNFAGLVSPRTILLFWPVMLPVLVLIPGLTGFPYPSAEADYSDVVLAHYPYAVYLRQTLIQQGQAPLWSALLFSGSPFAANPLSGIFYLPGWLALILPLPLGFNLLVIAHLLWGGIGMALFLRSEGKGDRAAVFGGLAFAALPKLFAHYGAGHLTLLYAVPWTPWLLLASRQHLEPIRRGRWERFFCWEAPILGLIFLADPRWCLLAALVWWGYRLLGSFPARAGQASEPVTDRLAGLFSQSVFAALLAAPLALPLIEFTRLSTRSTMTSQDSLTFSLPWARILGLVIPDIQGFHEYMLYAGQGLALLSVLAVVWGMKHGGVRFWGAVFLVSLLYAFGENLPFGEWIADLPLFDLLRVPTRALFLSGIALIVLAAGAFQQLIDAPPDRAKRTGSLALTSYTGALLALAFGVWFLVKELPINFAWAAVFALCSAIWIGLCLAGRLSQQTWVTGFYLLCLIDWAGIDRTLFAARPHELVLSEKAGLAQQLKEIGDRQGLFRVYSPSYSLPQQTAADFGLQLADGVDPLHLQAYAEYMERATGVPRNGYSVTLPPFENGDPRTANQAYQPDPELLGMLNVEFVASEFEIHADGLVYEGRDTTTYLYRNMRARPRAWVMLDNRSPGMEDQPVEIITWRPNHISLEAKGPGLLVLSEVDFPGWLASVDAAPMEIVPYRDLLRAVRIGPGMHRVTFEFRPLSVYLGLGIGIAFWLLWGAGFVWKRSISRE